MIILLVPVSQSEQKSATRQNDGIKYKFLKHLYSYTPVRFFLMFQRILDIVPAVPILFIICCNYSRTRSARLHRKVF